MAIDQNTENQEGREMSDAELAQAYLTREIEEANKRLADIEHQSKFYRTYKPTPPGPRPHPDDGGMDHSDWEVAQGEYEQWPEEREETLEHLATEQETLYGKSADLQDLGVKAERGDANTIALLAGRERARKEAVAEQERITRAQKEGVALDGIDEVISQIQELRQVDWKKDPNSQWDSVVPTPNGWRQYYDHEYGFTYALGEADLGNPKIAMQVGQGHSWEQSASRSQHILRVRYLDLSNMSAERAAAGIKVHKQGLGLHFEIDTNRKIVLNHSATQMEPGFTKPNENKARSNGKSFPMTQDHFNGFKSNLTSLIEGVKMSSSS